MKKTSNFEFLNLPTYITDELENPDWKTGGRVHNWKNYVDSDFQGVWQQLTFREKQIIVYFADIQAGKEEWD